MPAAELDILRMEFPAARGEFAPRVGEEGGSREFGNRSDDIDATRPRGVHVSVSVVVGELV